MTTLRSSWPSRLRQLLSNEGAIGPSVKLDTEPVSVSLVCSLSNADGLLIGFKGGGNP